MDAELVVSLAIVAVGAAALAVGMLSYWRRPRCPDCGTRALPDAADPPASGLPIVILSYRCADCRRVVHRRYLGAWD
jgi:hypothetical protein